MRYFDSGVLLKLYFPEPRTPEAIQFFQTATVPPPFTLLHDLEVRSAMRQKLGRREIDSGRCASLLQSLDADRAAGLYSTPTVLWPEVFARAEAFSEAHGASTLCRSLDTLHVALAAVIGTTEFCTFDTRQARMAAACGLRVVP